MSALRKAAIYGYLVSAGGAFGGAALVSALLGDREGRVWWPISRWGSAGLLRVSGARRLLVEGADRLDPNRPAVVVANHRSLLDPAVLMHHSPVPLRFLAKHTLGRYPIFGRALREMGHIFVNRSDRGKAAMSLKRAAQAVREGRTVLVFPEGTRSKTDELLPFKRGAFELAIEAGVPIVPAWIEGAGEILAPGGRVGRAGTIVLLFGEPIETHGASKGDVAKLVESARARMAALADRARELSAETPKDAS